MVFRSRCFVVASAAMVFLNVSCSVVGGGEATPKRVAPLRSVMLTREDVPGATDVKWSNISGYQSNCPAADDDLNLTLSSDPETQLSVERLEGDGMSVTQALIFNLIESDEGGRVRARQAEACPVFCVSVLQVGVDSVGVGGGELGQGLVPVGVKSLDVV